MCIAIDAREFTTVGLMAIRSNPIRQETIARIRHWFDRLRMLLARILARVGRVGRSAKRASHW